MKQFKIKFPSGYEIADFFNDNIDLHVILPDNRIFFATAFTIINVQYLIEKEQDVYFWLTDMFIVKDLKKITIKRSVEKIIADGFF
ncbi:hypothetical protein [Pedobacter terrae]|uniref:hypothetical protein n=1 Tax=Pedobacter terrae TaxID=405671 RepID=UPI002FF5E604